MSYIAFPTLCQYVFAISWLFSLSLLVLKTLYSLYLPQALLSVKLQNQVGLFSERFQRKMLLMVVSCTLYYF